MSFRKDHNDLADCPLPSRFVSPLACGTVTGGFEMGMRRAMEQHQPDWLVLMDDDGRPAPDGLASFHRLDMHQAAQDPAQQGWDAVAAAVYFPTGGICEMNRPSRNPFWHRREFLRTLFGGGHSGFHVQPLDYQGAGMQIDVTSFVGFFISAAAVRARATRTRICLSTVMMVSIHWS